MKDAILAEIHQIKDEIARSYGYDVRAMLTDIMARQEKEGRTLIAAAKATAGLKTRKPSRLPRSAARQATRRKVKS